MYNEAFVATGANVVQAAANFNAAHNVFQNDQVTADKNRIVSAINRGEAGLNANSIADYIENNNLESVWSE